jgi:tRNA(Ile)-lysidine synthase
MSKTILGRVERTFRETVRRHAMVSPGDRVLAACSGGPDSVALVALLLKLREQMPLEVIVAHFNHRLRPEAAADEAFVRDLARSLVLPLVCGAKDVRREAGRKRLNLEEAARGLRYEFLREAARKRGATRIATGHTMNDQAETVLMRLFRGTGLTGLAGIEPVSGPAGCPIVRPLLGLKRGDIEAFLRAEGLESRADASNLDRRLLRNRVRLGLLPEIERSYGPRVVEHLATLASLAREEDELLDGFVRELADEFITRRAGETALDVKTLALLPPALARRVVREFIRELKGDLRAVSFKDIETVLGLREGGRTTVKKGLALRREGGRLLRDRPERAPRAFERRWDGRGTIAVAGAAFRGTRLDRDSGLSLHGDDRRRVLLDLEKLRLPLLIRGRRPGDLYRPLGAPGRKKLTEALRARGIARGDRDRSPLFLSRGEIVWVPGLPVAEKFKVGPSTKTVLLVEKKGRAGRAQRR